MAELLPHLAMMHRIPDCEQGVGLSWCRPVPITLDEESFTGALVDVFPCLRGGVREFVGSRAYNGAILIV